MDKNLGVSDFYKASHPPQAGRTYTPLTDYELVALTLAHWNEAEPGTGEKDLSRKILVPVPVSQGGRQIFFTGTAVLDRVVPLQARVAKRPGQPEEDYHVVSYVRPWDAAKYGLAMEEVKSCRVVCYSAAALEENGGRRSTDCDWEVVTILANATGEVEPMRVLTMARNQTGAVGGTKGEYTAQQYAEAVMYWSRRVRVIDDRLGERRPVEIVRQAGEDVWCYPNVQNQDGSLRWADEEFGLQGRTGVVAHMTPNNANVTLDQPIQGCSEIQIARRYLRVAF